MSDKPPAALLLFAAAAAAVVLWTASATIVVGACVVVLFIGFRWKRVVLTMLSGWFLYVPLASALAKVLPAAWSYLASGLFVIVVSERLVFEYETSAVLVSRTGVDGEARSLISEVSRAHRRRLSVYVALSAGVMAASLVVAGLTSYASELIAATILLMLVTMVYATR